jgi:hypothetical protein
VGNDKFHLSEEIGSEVSDVYVPERETGEFLAEDKEPDLIEGILNQINDMPGVLKLKIVKEILTGMNPALWNIILNHIFHLFSLNDDGSSRVLTGENERAYEQVKVWFEGINSHADRIEATRRLIREGVLIIDKELATEILDKLKSRFSDVFKIEKIKKP